LIRLALPAPAGALALLIPLGALAVHARLLIVGVLPQTPTVVASAVERLERLPPDLRRRVSRTARENFGLNRPILAAGYAAAIALVAISVATGIFGVRAAASERTP